MFELIQKFWNFKSFKIYSKVINFTPSEKRKLSEKQREKMKEKRDSSHIPAMYSACDNSQSRSQYYDDTQVVLIKPKMIKI